MRMVNLTDAVGVIPVGAKYHWETIEDSGGTHEYLCIEAILWKRASAYAKIKRDGIVSQSMEINVKDKETVDGYCLINKFIFTAFCLLGDGIEPCFEAASLQTFSLSKCKEQFELMMAELSEQYSKAITSNEDDTINKELSKGGDYSLNKEELLSKYGLTVEELDFDINAFSISELTEKFEAIKAGKSGAQANGSVPDEEDNVEGAGSGDPTDDDDDEPVGDGDDSGDGEGGEGSGEGEDSEPEGTFALTEQFKTELLESLYSDLVVDPYWGEMPRYSYVDYDAETKEVYCFDVTEWKLYGIKYSVDGDSVKVDFTCKSRKKFAIVDFNEGETDVNYESTFSAIFSRIKAETDELRAFKKEKLDAERKVEVEKLFSSFVELDGNEAFTKLKDNHSDMTLEEIENKCYEIKGRMSQANFALEKPQSVRIPINTNNTDDEPYGGLFVKYRQNN